MPPSAGLIEPLNWPAQRWLYCRAALRQRAGRWAGWAATGLLLANVGSDDPVATTLGLIGLLALPVFAASQAGGLAWGLVTLAYAGLISLLLRALRPVLWASTWQEGLQALPVPLRALQRSDTQVLLAALAPLAALLACAWWVWAGHAPGASLSAGASLLVALALGLAAGHGLLRGWRSHGGQRAPTSLQRMPRLAQSRLTLLAPQTAWQALLWRPLWLGPAQRTGRWQAGGVLLLGGLGSLAVWRWPAQLPWTLAAFSAASLVWLSRANALSREELGPLLARAAEHLPLPAAALGRWRQAQVLLPALVLISGLAVLAALAAPAALWRPQVLLLWWLVQVVVYTLEVTWPPAQRADESARWWFCLVLLLALSSEVLQ